MAKASFRSQFNLGETKYYAPSGERTEMRHTAHITKEGRRFLAKDKKVEIYALIQSHKEECEIENIIRRAVEGDYNALNAVNGSYMDITNCPSSIAEAQQYIINAKEEFEKLPKSIKAKFEYNPEIYIAEMSGNTESWLEKMGYNEAVKLQKEQEIKENPLANAEGIFDIAGGTQVNNSAGEVKENE